MAIIETTIKDTSSARVRIAYNEFIRNANSNRGEIAKLYAEAIDPWVPYKTGKLSHPYINSDGEIVYSARNERTGFNYAAMQYNRVDYNHNRNVHPYATDHWDIVADPIIWPGFVHDVNELLGTKGAQHRPKNAKTRSSRAKYWSAPGHYTKFVKGRIKNDGR
jgi:hypothetical protein